MTDLLFRLIRERYFLMFYPPSLNDPNGTMIIRLQKGDNCVTRTYRQTHFIYGNVDPDFLLRENIEAMMMEVKNEETK